MTRQTDDADRHVRMMLSPDNWPVWPVLPIKRLTHTPQGQKRETALLWSNDDVAIYLVPNKNMMQSVYKADILPENVLTPDKAREMVADGWVVD